MQIKRITRNSETTPQADALAYAEKHGFELRREPFGRRGSLIEIYRDGAMLGYRKSYAATINFMKSIETA